MTELVTRNYWWLRVTRDMGRYIKECNLCQIMINYIKPLAEKLIVNNMLKKL